MNGVPLISHDPGTRFNYLSIEGPRLVLQTSVENRMYVDAGTDELFGTDDDYINEFTIPKGSSDGNALQAQGFQRLIDDIIIAEGNGVFGYRFCQ